MELENLLRDIRDLMAAKMAVELNARTDAAAVARHIVYRVLGDYSPDDRRSGSSPRPPGRDSVPGSRTSRPTV